MDSLMALGRGDISREKIARFLLNTDENEEELIVMAETSAYFHVAYKVRVPSPYPFTPTLP